VNLREKDPLQKRLEITNWIILTVILVIGFSLGSTHFSLGILCGGLISVVNFHWLYRNLLSVFTTHAERPGKALLIRYYLRLALTAFVLYWVISDRLVDVIGLVIGLSVVFMNIVLTTIWVLSKKKCVGEVR
jgi:hypothetical protein